MSLHGLPPVDRQGKGQELCISHSWHRAVPQRVSPVARSEVHWPASLPHTRPALPQHRPRTQEIYNHMSDFFP